MLIISIFIIGFIDSDSLFMHSDVPKPERISNQQGNLLPALNGDRGWDKNPVPAMEASVPR